MVNGAKKILLRVFQERGHCDGGKHRKLLYGLLIVFLDDGFVPFFSCVSAPQITGVRKCNGVHVDVVVPDFAATVSGAHLIENLDELYDRRNRCFLLAHKNSFRRKTKSGPPGIWEVRLFADCELYEHELCFRWYLSYNYYFMRFAHRGKYQLLDFCFQPL